MDSHCLGQAINRELVVDPYLGDQGLALRRSHRLSSCHDDLERLPMVIRVTGLPALNRCRIGAAYDHQLPDDLLDIGAAWVVGGNLVKDRVEDIEGRAAVRITQPVGVGWEKRSNCHCYIFMVGEKGADLFSVPIDWLK